MEKTSIYKFYKLGQLFSEFELDKEQSNIELYNRLTNLLDFVGELKLHVTYSAIKLSKIISYYKTLDKQVKKFPKKNVNSDFLKKVSASIKRIITTFEAEIVNKNSYILNEKKIPLKHLTIDQTNLFKDENVLLIAPFDVQYHTMESTFCLAFERNTASAFHILLAIEEYARFFNKHYIKENGFTKPNFYEVVVETEKILDELNYESELISFLHIIRKYYRNQSQHSNRKFTEDDATELLNICIKVMNEMYSVLKETLPNKEYT